MSDAIVIEPGLLERNYWRDLWRYRELFYVSRMARLGRAVQADGDRHDLGGDPAAADHGGLYRHFRTDCEVALRG